MTLAETCFLPVAHVALGHGLEVAIRGCEAAVTASRAAANTLQRSRRLFVLCSFLFFVDVSSWGAQVRGDQEVRGSFDLQRGAI